MRVFIYFSSLRSSFLALICSLVFTSTCFGMERFKLGFEFQESSCLCPRASKDYNLQKRPLFSLKEEDGAQTLWHVEFDTDDIEFVTKPFSPEEEVLVRQCTKTILESINILRTTPQQLPLKQWVASLKKRYKQRLVFEDKFREAEDILIEKPNNWIPKFSPQVTIQHPLRHTIFLYFGLFGFTNSAHMFPFVASLPYLDLFLKFHKEADSTKFKNVLSKYNTPICGLTFLHALTMVQMTPNEDTTDSALLISTHEMLTRFQQVDPKIRLTLMSRRPFSDMLRDIPLPPSARYSDFFYHAMAHNQSFTAFGVHELFCRANYAEQYFDSDTGAERSLSTLSHMFREEFVQANEETLMKLLERGVVSTVMVRNLKPEAQGEDFESLMRTPSNYFRHVIDSVASPNKRYIIREEDLTIADEQAICDCLSPPEFLSSDNSMGALTGDNFMGQDKAYGEAIVEVRGIAHVEDWFIRRMGLPPAIKGMFLTVPTDSLIQEAITLFSFLKTVGTPTDAEDIQLGLVHAAYKH